MTSKPYLLAGTMLSTFAMWQPAPAQAEQAGLPIVVAQQAKEEGKERRGGRPEGQQRPARQEQRPAQPQRPAAQQQQPQQQQRPAAQQQRPAGQQQPAQPRPVGQQQQQQQKPAQPQQSGRPGASSGRPAAQDQKQQQRPEQRPAAQERRQERPEQRRDVREQKQKQEQPQRSFGQPPRPAVPPAAQDRPSPDPQRREAGEERRRDQRDGDRRETARERLDRDGPRRIDAVRKERREERRGDRVVINEPGGRTIIRENNGRVIIRHDETRRFSAFGQARTERRGADRVSIVARPGGVEIVSVFDGEGRLIRRVRRVGGREFVLINNRPRGLVVTDYYVRLPPPRLRIPRERYMVAAAVAAPALIFQALTAPPVEELERAYTLDEVRYSEPVRARMPRVDLDTVTFDTGSWELAPEQIERLAVVAEAINKALEANPNEVFMIEGHTDAVGNEEDNLSLSDRRAETVAMILTEEFKVPPENLVTQGYGPQHLKVDTQAAEQQNRRVTVLRITPLLAREGTTGSAN